MILVISPAKRLDFKHRGPVVKDTKPLFLSRASGIMDELRPLTPQQLSKLLGLGEKLAQTSWERHQNWSADCDAKVCKPAIYAYKGDVYQGMQPEQFTAEQNRFMEKHLRILSSLYGILRPFDLIQPYRLQMDTPLKVQGHKDLYSFWSREVNKSLAGLLNKDPDHTLINLASDEYFRVIDSGKVPGKIIKPVFKENVGGKYKVVSFHAKRARGMMCRFIIGNRLTDPEHLKLFNSGNYIFTPENSGEHEWFFLRG